MLERHRKSAKVSNNTPLSEFSMAMEHEHGPSSEALITETIIQSPPSSPTQSTSSTPSTSSSTSTPNSSFTTKQSFHRSVSRADDNLPKSPHKKLEVVEKLEEKYLVKMPFRKGSRGRPRKDLSEEERDWLIKLLARADMTYTNPGRKDNVYIGIKDGERIYKQKLYLLWTLRDLFEIVNGSGKIKLDDTFFKRFGKEITFSQLYDFLKAHKEYAWNKNIPQGSCLCEICENTSLLAKGLNKALENPIPTNPHDLIEKFACDLKYKECALNKCPLCSTFDFGPRKCDTSEDSDSDSDSSDDSSSTEIKFFSWIRIDKKMTKAQFSASFEEAVESMEEKLKVLKEHIYVKRVQYAAYVAQKEKLKPGELLVHVDFAENYKNDQQDEIQSAYFGHDSFSLFTSCCYYVGADNNINHQSFVIVTESSDHNRVTSMSSLKKVVELAEEKVDVTFDRIIVWSDGMGSQFRSRFVFRLLATILFRDKLLSWFYNERHHGKGPMDGIGGTLKNVVYRKVKSKQVVIYEPKDFAKAASKFVPSVQTVYLPSESEITEPEDIESAPAIKDTLQVHKFERCVNDNGDCSIKFFKTAAEVEPFHVQWYNASGRLMCDHIVCNVGDNICAKCTIPYSSNDPVWLKCPSCEQWFHENCFYM